jgi:hypothetical protein
MRLDASSWWPWSAWSDVAAYSIDAWQRSILFLDVLRQRGNRYHDQMARAAPHVLRFEGEVLIDGRTLERPTNYGLVRIVPPAGTRIDERKRPIVVVDPRAGQAPGIGGFKADSEIGAAFRAGHPRYFVGFRVRSQGNRSRTCCAPSPCSSNASRRGIRQRRGSRPSSATAKPAGW